MDIVTAAALLVGIDLQDSTDMDDWHALLRVAIGRGASRWERDLTRAIKTRTLLATRVAVKDLDSRKPMQIDPRAVTEADLLDPSACEVSESALLAWCNETGAPIPPLLVHPYDDDAVAGYPPKLRAAIEAFEAVSRDPAATATKSAKNALLAWLAEYKPELSINARDAVATVANWQPQGGAPKTPG
jgi:hypothetical protein